MSSAVFQRFTKKNIVLNTALVGSYLLLTQLMGGIRSDQWATIALWLIGYYCCNVSRKLVLGFAFFMLYWIIYDSMRVLPNYTVNIPHIQQPYEIEKWLFGIEWQQMILTPNEFFALHTHAVLDFLSGLFYINWVPIPLAFGLYLLIKNPFVFLKFSLAFLLVNLVGFVIYYAYPAAPPWYVETYGFDLHIGVAGSRAGLARFDALIHYPLFEGIYNKNANVLAAMPSLHATYPLIVFFYAIQTKMRWWTIAGFAIFMLGIWFSAVYSNHHYIIDVLVGVLMALATLLCFEWICKRQFCLRWLGAYAKAIKLKP